MITYNMQDRSYETRRNRSIVALEGPSLTGLVSYAFLRAEGDTTNEMILQLPHFSERSNYVVF